MNTSADPVGKTSGTPAIPVAAGPKPCRDIERTSRLWLLLQVCAALMAAWWFVRAASAGQPIGHAVLVGLILLIACVQGAVHSRSIARECERLRAEGERLTASLGELAESQERSRLLLNAVEGLAVFTLDASGRVATWNAGAERVMGYRAEEVLGQHVSRFYTQEDVARGEPGTTFDPAAPATSHKQGWRVRKDGSRFLADATVTPLSDGHGDPSGFCVVTRDATQQRLADEALRRSKRELTDFFENGAVGLHWIGPDGCILKANRAELEMLGYDADEYVGHNIAEFYVDPAAIRGVLDRLAHGAPEQSYEAQMRCRDGSVKDVLVNSNVYRENGEFIHTRCFTRDITDRNQAERDFRESEARKAAILETSLDCIISIDQDGRVAEFNPAAERMFGRTRAEALGHHMPDLFGPVAGDPEDSRNGLAHYLSPDAVSTSGERIELTATRADGTTFPIEMAVRIHASGPVMFTAYIRDISERKRAEEAIEVHRIEIERSNQELAEKNRKLSELYQTANRFVDDVSHEFRTPLAVIKGYAEVMKEGLAGTLNPQQLEFAGLIFDRARDMAQMVDDLLDTSKLRAGSLRVDRRGCAVADIFSRIRGMVETKAAANRIQVQETIENELPEVFADAEKAGRVLLNLAVNAIKFSPAGAAVELWARRGAPGEVEIGVTDRGSGISAENLAMIFDRFKQVEGRTHIKGFGLGLNIAKELSSLNLGGMHVSSRLGEGSRFWFTLPVNEPQVILSHLQEMLAERGTPSGKLAQLRVTPHESPCVPEALRGFLASVSHPGDVILPTADRSALILFGYSEKPDRWVHRLREAAALVNRGNPSQSRCGFEVELAGVWAYPEQQDEAIEAVLEQTGGVLTYA